VVTVICMASMAQALNLSCIRLASDRLSRRLLSFTDAVLHTQVLTNIYTSVDYDVIQIDGSQVVNRLSSRLGKLLASKQYTFGEVLCYLI